MNESTISVGILGGGNISDTHARAAASIPGVKVAAVCGQNRERVARLADQFGARAFDRLEPFLDSRPLDLVAIGSPSALHAEQGIAAIQRGLHVLVEKPVDITSSRADSLIDAAEHAGVKLGVFFQDRLKPDVVRMKQLVDQGALGSPVMGSGRVRWYRPPEYYGGSQWRGTHAYDGGGALINQAIHTLDLLLYLFGPIAAVDARAGTRLHSIEVEDTLVATLQFASGALGTFEASTAIYPGYPRRVELTGTKGTLVLEHDNLVSIDLVGGGPPAPNASAPATVVQNVASATVSDATPHRRVFEDFIAAIRSGGTPACDGREGRRSIEVVDAIYASVKAGTGVTISSVPATGSLR